MSTDYGKVEALVHDLGKLLQTGHGADVIFIVGPQNVEFRAHSMLLAARCSALKDDVRAHLEETRKEDAASEAKGQQHRGTTALEICLPDVNPDPFMEALRFVYTGKVLVTLRNAFALYRIASKLGAPGLMRVVCRHLQATCQMDEVLEMLQEALSDALDGIVAVLTTFIAENCRDVLQTPAFLTAPHDVVLHILKQERLDASEAEIWDALIRRATACAGISPDAKVSMMSGLERQKVVEHMCAFMGPGLLRTLNIPTKVFADEVEPLGVLTPRDALLKYRFEATKDFAEFTQAFPAPCIDFINRIRRPRLQFESPHPHKAGARETTCVSLPSWATKVRVEFDERCKVGQYSELKFFQDEACTTLLSIFTDDRHKKLAGHKPQLSLDKGLTLNLPSTQFWFSFYSPQNFDPAWGYKFVVLTL